MLDADLAQLYEVETRALIQAVKRNRSRFPVDFMFQLTPKELSRVRIADLVSSGVRQFIYEYDFGDDWIHQIRIIKGTAGVPGVRCIAGARAGPPEDSGGPFGYESLLAARTDRASPDHWRVKEWLDPDFNPERFDPAETTRALAKVKVS